MNNYKFNLLEQSDDNIAKFKEFHNLIFPGTDASLAWFKWYFSSFVDIKPRVYTVSDNNKIIGSWCVENKKLLIDSKNIINVGRCFAVGIHPDHRRQNLFTELSMYAIEQERTKFKQFEYILGFPQGTRPVVDAHLKSGWERVQTIDMFCYKPSSLEKQRSLKCTRVNDFSSYESPRTTRYSGGFLESEYYKNGKWFDHPEHTYIVLSHFNAYVVIKQYGIIGHILDLNGSHEDVSQLLEDAKTLAYRHKWNELTIWNAHNEYHYDDIIKCGFVCEDFINSPKPPDHKLPRWIDMLAVKINADKPLEFNSCHFMMGSEEGY